MGANADPSGSLGGPHRRLSSPVPAPAPVTLPQHQHGVAASTVAALRHDPGLAARWSPEEQVLLDKDLAKFVADAPVVRYAKIAMSLPDKTVRDVALRCRWMAKKESSKKRKEELSKKSKEKKERLGDSSSKGPAHIVSRPNAPSYTVPVLPIDDDHVSYKGCSGSNRDGVAAEQVHGDATEAMNCWLLQGSSESRSDLSGSLLSPDMQGDPLRRHLETAAVPPLWKLVMPSLLAHDAWPRTHALPHVVAPPPPPGADAPASSHQDCNSCL